MGGGCLDPNGPRVKSAGKTCPCRSCQTRRRRNAAVWLGGSRRPGEEKNRPSQGQGQTGAQGRRDACAASDHLIETGTLHKETNVMDQRIIWGDGVWMQEKDRWHLDGLRYVVRPPWQFGGPRTRYVPPQLPVLERGRYLCQCVAVARLPANLVPGRDQPGLARAGRWGNLEAPGAAKAFQVVSSAARCGRRPVLGGTSSTYSYGSQEVIRTFSCNWRGGNSRLQSPKKGIEFVCAAWDGKIQATFTQRDGWT